MEEIFAEILKLQLSHSAKNTPDMQQRGKLIRDRLPESLNEEISELNRALRATYPGQVQIIGRDASGSKSYVPWVRLFDPKHSPNPQTGWYIVYLFCADGRGVYLCISHGSTESAGLVPRSDSELAALVAFAHDHLRSEIVGVPDITEKIDLAVTGRAKSYEKSTAVARFYDVNYLPSRDQLIADLKQFLGWLGVLYSAADRGLISGTLSQEEDDLNKAISPLKGRRQGYGLDAAERRAVEMRAMELTRVHLEYLGYSVTDVSSRESYDFRATRGDDALFVEVKGTTGTAGTVLMTSNEVKLHYREFPNNALAIVHEIQLERGTEPKASGGTLVYIQPWQVDQKALRPTAFEVSIPSQLLEDKKVQR